MDLCKVNFCISKLFIQFNTGSCCVNITSGVNIYLYVCVSLLVPVYPVCICVSDIKSEYHTQQGGAVTKVPKLTKFRSIISLTKINTLDMA